MRRRQVLEAIAALPAIAAIPSPAIMTEGMPVENRHAGSRGKLFVKDVGGVSDLFYEGEDGTVFQLTAATRGVF